MKSSGNGTMITSHHVCMYFSLAQVRCELFINKNIVYSGAVIVLASVESSVPTSEGRCFIGVKRAEAINKVAGGCEETVQ